MRNTFYFLLCCVPMCSTQVWRLAVVCVKFCNNIKKKMWESQQQPFSMSFLTSFMCSTRWMIAAVNFPASIQIHRYFWQAFDVALWWAVPLQWPLNGVNAPCTVQIKADALYFTDCLISHHFTQNPVNFESSDDLLTAIYSRNWVVTLRQRC